jgi:SAM-dependent methyltransferase
MPHKHPDFRHRSQLSERMDAPCTRAELRANLRDIARTNRWTLAHRPLLSWLDSLLPTLPAGRPLRILDVGCGYGDTLRRTRRWAEARAVPVHLTGLDLNPDAVAIAAEASHPTSGIHWLRADIFAYAPSQPFDLVISSLFTHHLPDSDVIRFLKWMERHALIGWFINDLYRAPVPYHFFRIASRLARLHPFVQNDGPISIARSFVPEDWSRLRSAAGLADHEVQIQSFRPARLCVARRKPR